MRKLTRAERRQRARAEAMPLVKKLVRKFGRSTINGCLMKIRDKEKTMDRMADLRAELREIEKKL